MENSGEIKDLAAALALAQGAFESISKSRTNPRFGHAYATLDDIISATRKALSANGLAVMQTTDKEEEGACVETVLVHSSGQWISTKLPIMVGNITSREGRDVLTQAQAYGSALTYARRYALAALLNVAAEEDDDAETTGEKSTEAVPRQDPTNSPVKAPKGLCPVHKIPFVHRKGTSKQGTLYSFWACPKRDADGKYCDRKPGEREIPIIGDTEGPPQKRGTMEEFLEPELSYKASPPAVQPVSPASAEPPEMPGAGKEAGQRQNEAPGAAQGQVKLGGLSPAQVVRLLKAAEKGRGWNRQGLEAVLGHKLEDIQPSDLETRIMWLEKRAAQPSGAEEKTNEG